VAAVLAVFLLYTSIAGGGTPSIEPSDLAGKTGVVTLVGVVQPGYKGDQYRDGLRFTLRDRKGSATVPVVYKGSVSDQFRKGREVSVKGELRNGVFVAQKDSLVTKCPSKYTAKKES
jgi:cytochrome c-type biogenesis protein CcmE